MPLIPKKTFALIRSINCHFLSQVKRNTAYLYDAIRLFTALTKPFATCQTLDTSAGRVEHRRIELLLTMPLYPKDGLIFKDLSELPAGDQTRKIL